jgi:hypothetical protein
VSYTVPADTSYSKRFRNTLFFAVRFAFTGVCVVSFGTLSPQILSSKIKTGQIDRIQPSSHTAIILDFPEKIYISHPES